jgi:U3 small nucleolar RNA-associated protein 3
LSYLTSVAFYFGLCARPNDVSALGLKDKALKRVAQLRECLSSLEDQGLGVDGAEDEDEDTETDGERTVNGFKIGRSMGELEADELEQLLQDAAEDSGEDDDDDGDGDYVEEIARPLKKRKTGKEEVAPKKPVGGKKNKDKGRGKKTTSSEEEEGLEPIPFPEDSSSSSTSRKRRAAAAALQEDDADLDLDDFVDPPTLSATDREDKASRKKSLRFYTAKIDAKAAKRAQGGLKGRERLGGDDDVPYRSRERSRRQVLQRQGGASEGGGEGTSAAGLDGMDWQQDDRDMAADVMGDGGDEGGDDNDAGEYYDLVKRAKVQKQVEKKAAHDRAREEERSVLLVSVFEVICYFSRR